MGALLEVNHLKKYFPIKKGWGRKPTAVVKAVDDVSFTINACETLGVVGESGCGKSTTGRSVLRLIEPTEGEIFFDGQDIRKLAPEQLRLFRKNMQIIFQDPMSSLDPRWTVERLIAEPLRVNGQLSEQEIRERVAQLMEVVGLPAFHSYKYPHEFSGGQRQRIGIARALALAPRLIVCDEPVSALDVSIQSQILNLMKDLQQKYQLSYMFISHDLSVVRYISDRIAVMYLGRIVEIGGADEVFARRLHPYTKALISALPVPDPHVTHARIQLEGDVPNPVSPPSGCTFHQRCSYCMERCRTQAPQLREVEPGHFAACHLFDQ